MDHNFNQYVVLNVNKIIVATIFNVYFLNNAVQQMSCYISLHRRLVDYAIIKNVYISH